MKFKPPTPPKPRPQAPIVLTDDRAKAIYTANRPVLKDGPVPVAGELIGFKRTDTGLLGAIYVNPLTDSRFLFGIRFRDGTPMMLAALPKTSSGRK